VRIPIREKSVMAYAMIRSPHLQDVLEKQSGWRLTARILLLIVRIVVFNDIEYTPFRLERGSQEANFVVTHPIVIQPHHGRTERGFRSIS